MTARQTAQRILRGAGLLSLADTARFQLQRLRLSGDNAQFRRKHPDFAAPPLHLLYEIGGRVRLAGYFEEGDRSSLFLSDRAKGFLGEGPKSVLDWGCGVACVVRHMPRRFPGGSKIFGSDYNGEMIAWAKEAVPGVSFSKNELFPPLPFDDGLLDWVYGLSVITHLSDEALRAWLKEFYRLLSPGGVLTLTTNGTRCEGLFSPEETTAYQQTGYVIRAGLDEGRKMYLAYHKPDYFREVVAVDWEVLDFVPGGMLVTGQDLWWLRPRR